MQYWHWLLIVSLAFVAVERLRPRRRDQGTFRRGWYWDLGYLVLNGHFVGLGLAIATRPLQERVAGWLEARGWAEYVFADAASTWPMWAQVIVALVALDFVQWLTHVALHRVPALWAFHKVHHSIEDLDWVGNFRFHFMEIVVYKTTQYLPLVWFGFSGSALLAVAVFGTIWGHFNHANLDVRLGPLEKVFNSPRMHIWHHHDEPGRGAVNFGIVFSLWDWMFGTAWLPDRDPQRLGFDGLESYPKNLFGQAVWPFRELLGGGRQTPGGGDSADEAPAPHAADDRSEATDALRPESAGPTRPVP